MNRNAWYIVAALAVSHAACSNNSEGPMITVAAARTADCPANSNFKCSDTSFWATISQNKFGTAAFPIDKDGCMLRQCFADGDCAAAEICFKPECYGSNWQCSEKASNGQKICECTDDPSCAGSYCKAK